MTMYGMGMGRFFLPPIAHVAEPEPAQVKKPLLDRVHEQTVDLIVRMKDRREYWRQQLAEAAEELRQTEVTLEAATAMLGVLVADRDEAVLNTMEGDIEADLLADIAKAKAASLVDHPLDI